MIKQRLAKLEARVKDAGIVACPECQDGNLLCPCVLVHDDEAVPPDAFRCPACGREVPENMQRVITVWVTIREA